MQRTLSRARQQIRSIRVLLWMYAAGYGIWTALMLPLWGASDLRDLATVGTGLITVVGVSGGLFIHRQPFAWTLCLAILQTGLAAVGWFGGGIPVLDTVIALGLWGSVPLMRSASDILHEHAGAFSSEDLVRRVGRDVAHGETRAQADEVSRRELVRRSRTSMMVVLIAFGVVVVGVLLYWLATLSATIEARLAAFEEAWEGGDFTTVQAMCTNDYRRRSWSKVERILRREGWLQSPPLLGAPDFAERRDSWAEVQFALPKGKLRTKWIRLNSAWKLDGVIFSDIRD